MTCVFFLDWVCAPEDPWDDQEMEVFGSSGGACGGEVSVVGGTRCKSAAPCPGRACQAGERGVRRAPPTSFQGAQTSGSKEGGKENRAVGSSMQSSRLLAAAWPPVLRALEVRPR